jgi:hypothetical protein
MAGIVVNPFRFKNELWTPKEINTSLWLDASDEDTIVNGVGGNVAEWQDKSGNGNDAVQTNASNQPMFDSVNNKLVFDGLFKTLNTGLEQLTNTSIYIVLSTEDRGSSLNNVVLGASNSFNTGGVFWTLEAFPSTDIANDIYYGTRLSYEFAFWNGQNIDPLDRSKSIYSHNAVNVSTENLNYTIGTINIDSVGSVNLFKGSIYEILITNEVSTTEQRQLIEGYLAHKWGLSSNLPSDHPYKSIAPVKAKYTSWSPKRVNPSLWLDASDEDTVKSDDNGKVSRWIDKSGYRRDAVQDVELNQPVLVDNYIESDNVNQFMQSERTFNDLYSTDISVFIVAKIHSIGKNFDLMMTYLDNSNVLGFAIERYSALDYPQFRVDSDTNFNQGASLTEFTFDDTIEIYNFEANSNNTRFGFENGNQYNLTNWLGNEFNAISPVRMKIIECVGRYYEIITVSDGITTQQRQRIEGYLAHKWGLTDKLPSDHPYKYDGRLFGYGLLWSPEQIQTSLWLDASDESSIVN